MCVETQCAIDLELAKMHHPDSVGAMSSSTEIGNNWQRVVNAKNELQRAVALPIKRAQKPSHFTRTKIATPLARKQSMPSVHPPNQAMFARTTLQSQEPLPHNTEDFPINNSQSTSPSGKPTPDKPIQPPTDFRPKPPRPSKWPGLTRLKETRNTTIKAQHTNLAFTTAPNTFIRDGPWKYTGGKRIELNSVENLNIAAAPIWVHLWNVAAIQLFKMHGSLYYNPPSRIVFSESFPYRLLHFKQQITVAVESGRAVSPLSHIWTSRFQKGFDYRIIRDRPNSTVVFYPFRWKDLARTIVYGFIPFSLLGIIGITWKIFRLIFVSYFLTCFFNRS